LARPVVAASLLSAGGAHSLFSALGLSLIRFRAILPPAVPTFLWGMTLVVLAVIASFVSGLMNEHVRLIGAVMLLVAFASRHGWTRWIVCLATVLLTLGVSANRRDGPGEVQSPFQPVFSFDDLRTPEAEAARAAALHSPPDALFVTPPQFGILRLVGRRALVVDFEALPFQPQQMRAWRERIRDVYGDVDEGGHDAREALDRGYHQISDAHLRSLAQRYGASHALLYADTKTALPEVYSDDRYRVVRLESVR
jgi:hypothetical protein